MIQRAAVSITARGLARLQFDLELADRGRRRVAAFDRGRQQQAFVERQFHHAVAAALGAGAAADVGAVLRHQLW